MSCRSHGTGFLAALGVAWFPMPHVCCSFASQRSVCAGSFPAVLTGACRRRWAPACCGRAERKGRRHREQSFGSVSSTGPFRSLKIAVSLSNWKLLEMLKTCLFVHALVNVRSDSVGLVSLECSAKNSSSLC